MLDEVTAMRDNMSPGGTIGLWGEVAVLRDDSASSRWLSCDNVLLCVCFLCWNVYLSSLLCCSLGTANPLL
jgi:hypothetical protein